MRNCVHAESGEGAKRCRGVERSRGSGVEQQWVCAGAKWCLRKLPETAVGWNEVGSTEQNGSGWEHIGAKGHQWKLPESREGQSGAEVEVAREQGGVKQCRGVAREQGGGKEVQRGCQRVQGAEQSRWSGTWWQ